MECDYLRQWLNGRGWSQVESKVLYVSTAARPSKPFHNNNNNRKRGGDEGGAAARKKAKGAEGTTVVDDFEVTIPIEHRTHADHVVLEGGGPLLAVIGMIDPVSTVSANAWGGEEGDFDLQEQELMNEFLAMGSVPVAPPDMPLVAVAMPSFQDDQVVDARHETIVLTTTSMDPNHHVWSVRRVELLEQILYAVYQTHCRNGYECSTLSGFVQKAFTESMSLHMIRHEHLKLLGHLPFPEGLWQSYFDNQQNKQLCQVSTVLS